MARLGALARMSMRRLIGGGAGGGGSASLALDTSALVFYDSFNRADAEAVGAPDFGTGDWVEEQNAADADITTNRLVLSGSAQPVVHRPNAEAVTGPILSQCIVRWDSATIPAALAIVDTAAFASRTGYNVRGDDFNDLLSLDEVPFVQLATAAFTLGTATDYGYELYTDDGVQAAAIVATGVPGTVATASAADLTNNGDSRRITLHRGSGTANARFDAAFAAAGANARQIVVTGVPTGHTIEVRRVSDDSVVVSGAESSGTVTIRVDMFDGTDWTASLTVWPALAGEALYMALVDGAMADVDTLLGSGLTGGNVWPGAYVYA